MKVNPLTVAQSMFNRVDQKKDQDGSKDDQKNHEEKQHKDDQSSEFDEQLVQEAIKAFQSDSHAHQKGINAKQEGEGPGLKVVLTGADGRVLRSLSGEEFLKLRESTSRTHGKLLDQKA